MICECAKFYANYEYQDKKYCSSCYEKVSATVLSRQDTTGLTENDQPLPRIEYNKCECKEGYFAYYEFCEFNKFIRNADAEFECGCGVSKFT